MARKILVTAALPYANGPIHMGHLVEYIQTDIWVRFQKLRGHDCIYCCADDTHGTPVMIRARQEGTTPEELIAAMYEEHVRDFGRFEIEFDSFYSTHSEENRQLSETIFARNRAGGHIATREVEQAYCEHDKMFLPDRYIRVGDNTDVPQGLPNVPGRIIGRHGHGAWVVEWRWVPSAYMIGIHLGQPGPLVRRVDPADTGLWSGGLALVARDEQFPFEASVWRHRFGFGGGNRLNGVVMELGTGGTYSIPSGYS